MSAAHHETNSKGDDFGIFASYFGGIQVAEHRPGEEELPFEEGNFGTRLLPWQARASAQGEQRWLKGFCLDAPEERNYPYRFFRW